MLEVTLKGAASSGLGRWFEKSWACRRGAPEAGIAADPAALCGQRSRPGGHRDIAAPDVTTLNNEPAMVHAGTPGVSTLTLTVVPQISSDGIIQLSISPAFGERATTGEWAKAIPSRCGVAGADTVDRVDDGRTAMLSRAFCGRKDIAVKAAARSWSAMFARRPRATGHACWSYCCAPRS